MSKHKSYFYLLIANILVAFATIIVNALIPRMYSIEHLSNYLLIKRVIMTLLSLQLVGLNLSIPYYYPKYGDPKIFKDALRLALFITLPAILLTGSIVLWWGLLTNEIIGIRQYILYSFTLSLNVFTFSVLRAKKDFKKASIQHIKNMFIYPLFSLLVTDTLANSFLILFILSTIDNIVTLKLLFRTSKNRYSDALKEKSSYNIWMLVQYGINRFPMFISQVFLTALPLIYLKQIGDIQRIAVWGAGLTILRIVVMFAGPVNTIVLPRFSGMIANDEKYLMKEVWILNMSALALGPILNGVFYYWMGPVIQFWIGIDMIQYSKDISLISTIIPFMLATELIRSTVDSIHKKGINSYIYMAGVIIAGVLILIFSGDHEIGPSSILYYIMTSYILLYLFSILYLQRVLQFTRKYILSILFLFSINLILVSLIVG